MASSSMNTNALCDEPGDVMFKPNLLESSQEKINDHNKNELELVSILRKKTGLRKLKTSIKSKGKEETKIKRLQSIPTYQSETTTIITKNETTTPRKQTNDLNSTTNQQPKKTSKPRRRVATVAQRRAANIRERRRMFNLNAAFDKLRKKVPSFAYEKRLSRIETLKLAIMYIRFMDDLVNDDAYAEKYKQLIANSSSSPGTNGPSTYNSVSFYSTSSSPANNNHLHLYGAHNVCPPSNTTTTSITSLSTNKRLNFLGQQTTCSSMENTMMINTSNIKNLNTTSECQNEDFCSLNQNMMLGCRTNLNRNDHRPIISTITNPIACCPLSSPSSLYSSSSHSSCQSTSPQSSASFTERSSNSSPTQNYNNNNNNNQKPISLLIDNYQRRTCNASFNQQHHQDTHQQTDLRSQYSAYNQFQDSVSISPYYSCEMSSSSKYNSSDIHDNKLASCYAPASKHYENINTDQRISDLSQVHLNLTEQQQHIHLLQQPNSSSTTSSSSSSSLEANMSHIDSLATANYTLRSLEAR